MERLGDRLGNYYSTWLASPLSCCLPRLQDQPTDDEAGLKEPKDLHERSRRDSPVPGMYIANEDIAASQLMEDGSVQVQ